VSGYLDEVGASGKSLDYGAGMGLNAKAAKIDDTFEPFPQEGFTPTFDKPSAIPTNSYGKIISTNVINVLPPKLRANAVLNIGRALKKKGKALIQTWDANAAKAGMKSKKATIVKTESNAFTTSTGSYQKGFTNKELKSYAENTLGDGYIVETVPNRAKISGSAIVVTKK
jgi:SAM-dependent methyltransferase